MLPGRLDFRLEDTSVERLREVLAEQGPDYSMEERGTGE
jgi:hypothetical protein